MKKQPSNSLPTRRSQRILSEVGKSQSNVERIYITCETDEKRFLKKWRTRPIAAERFFNLQALERHKLDLKYYTDYQGWSHFLQIKETYYPRLVQAFFYQAHCDNDTNTIRSIVKGIEIVLDVEFIAKFFKLPTDGLKAYGSNWYSQTNVTIDEVRESLFKPTTPKDQFTTPHLKLLPKIFNIISKGNIMPRQGKYDALGGNDLMVIHHLFERKRLNLPFIIIKFMMEVANWNNKKLCVSYGMVLTQIFKHFEVSLKGETAETKVKRFDLKNLKHFKPDPTPNVPIRTYTRKRSNLDNTAQSVQADQVVSEPEPPNLSDQNDPFIPSDPILEEENLHTHSSPPLAEPRNEINLNVPPSNSQINTPLISSPQTESPQVVPQLGVTQATTQLDPNTVLEPLLSEQTISPLFSSPPNFNFSPLFNENPQGNFFNSSSQNIFDQPFFNDILNPPPVTTIPPMQAMPFMNDAGPSNPQPQPQPMPNLPRSKTERNIERIKRDIKKLFQGQQLIDNHLSYITMENSIMRAWFRNVVCYLYNLPYPEHNPYPPPVHVMPQPSPSSSSGDSTPNQEP
ncbi:hypothetical protein TSUD_394760 [Trifolium subterraneum]|uniref:Putative plant transposon protein domain-containing protein n=1 Tax=Trifolium subterraneum TaxID=3900 RepID=A0A2Z6MU56_TRISU|nr:hypothetical protein TSUD_394760 [Trifolium subterraneum]